MTAKNIDDLIQVMKDATETLKAIRENMREGETLKESLRDDLTAINELVSEWR